MHVLVVFVEVLVSGCRLPVRYIELAANINKSIASAGEAGRVVYGELAGMDLGDVLDDPLR
jgi:hypothetical protein